MALNSDPNALVDVPLHAGPDTPVFVYRFLTCGEVSDRVRKRKAADDAADSDAMVARMDEALAVGLRGWRGLTDPDGKDVLYEVSLAGLTHLTWTQKLDLYEAVLPAVSIAEIDRKKLQPPSDSGQASTATPA